MNSITNTKPAKKPFAERARDLWNYFSLYEKIWFFSILILASVCAVIFPEEDVNGIKGGVIMALYLADTFLNILCELLISKQSKWNFIVSIFVELVEILICVLLAYRFATMASTLFFWLPDRHHQLRQLAHATPTSRRKTSQRSGSSPGSRRSSSSPASSSGLSSSAGSSPGST